MAERNSIMISRKLKRQYANISEECKQCNGSCWRANNQVATQKKARKMFGVIPNHCINGAENAVRCPAALGLL